MNFKRYIEASDTWVDSHYIMGTDTDTLTALPAVLYPNATTATVGLKGQAVQSSVPSPTSPVMPQGTGERTGNLFDYKTAYAPYINADGDVAATTLAAVHNSLADFVGQTVTIRVYCKTATATRVYVSAKIGNAQKTSNSIYRGNTGYMTLTVTPETADDYWLISYGSLGTGNNIYSDFMVNTGSTALPYEPYGYKIPILSAGTTTNNYLGEVETTRKIKKFVLNGTESEDVLKMPSPNLFYYKVQNGLPLNSGACRCTHYINNQVPNVQLNNDEVKLDVTNVWGSTANVIVFKDTSKATLEDFKTWLQQQYTSGTPVTVWYTLDTPQTAVINEPLMRIGDYADTLSNISIPVTAGGDTLSVGTTVQPSEVTVNYKGWHPVADVHEYDYLLASNPLCGIDTYKDELNLATGACTRKIQKLVLTGQENWSVVGMANIYGISISQPPLAAYTAQICSHFISGTNWQEVLNNDEKFGISSPQNQLVIHYNAPGSIPKFKAYLAQQYSAGTPVTVWYVLATPTTETITVPSGLSGTEEGYLNQSGTPTPTNPIYPTANEVKVWT